MLSNGIEALGRGTQGVRKLYLDIGLEDILLEYDEVGSLSSDDSCSSFGVVQKRYLTESVALGELTLEFL